MRYERGRKRSYYINGQAASERQAMERVSAAHVNAGGEPLTITAFRAHCASEEGREMLNEMSGHTVEIFAND
jgi:hypothetical protein